MKFRRMGKVIKEEREVGCGKTKGDLWIGAIKRT